MGGQVGDAGRTQYPTEISHLTISSRTQPAKGDRQTGAKEERTHENFLVRGKQVQCLGQASFPARGHGPVIHPKGLKCHRHLRLIACRATQTPVIGRG